MISFPSLHPLWKKPSQFCNAENSWWSQSVLKEIAFKSQRWVWLESLEEFFKQVDLEREEVFVHLKQKLSTLF